MKTKFSAKSHAFDTPVARPTREQIARRAKSLWESYGCPVGRDEEIWLEAERQLRGRAAAGPTAVGDTLETDSYEMKHAIEKIQTTGDVPRGTEQLIR